MIYAVRHGREHDPQRAEPLEWPPRRRSNPAPAEPSRERPQRREDAPRRKREKTPEPYSSPP